MKVIEPIAFTPRKRSKSKSKKRKGIGYSDGVRLNPRDKANVNEFLLNAAIVGAALFIAFRMSKDDKVTESVVPAPKNPNSPSESELFKPYEY